MSVSVAVCPRCKEFNELPACPNCNGMEGYRLSPLANGGRGLVCNACRVGYAHFQCVHGCGCWIPWESYQEPGVVGHLKKNLREYEDYRASRGEGCFISTELYGPDSEEVRLLRRFRDQHLLPSRLGQRLVQSYYQGAPAIIPWMRRTVLIRGPIRWLVGGVVRLIRGRTGAAGAAQKQTAPDNRK